MTYRLSLQPDIIHIVALRFCRGCMEEQSVVQERLPDPKGFLLHLIVTAMRAMNGDADDEPTIGGMNCLRQDL